MTEDSARDQAPILADRDRLNLHQLRLLEWMESRTSAEQKKRLDKDGQKAEPVARATPESWVLTRGVELYSWQEDCIRSWFNAGRRGTVKVVTGGGKTLLALAIAERLQNSEDADLRIAIVVPTIVLMNQWYEEFEQRSNLPVWIVGRLGGGYNDNFSEGRRILITVLASAYKMLPSLVNEDIGSHLLLIADECHRVGATEMSKVLAVRRKYSLGLSATPERDEEEEEEENKETERYEDSLLGKELGPVVYELTLARAVELGVVPKFTIRHFGLTLNGPEAEKYERLTRSIEDARKELRRTAAASKSSGGAFYRWVRSVSEKGSGWTSTLAARFMMDTRQRKELLYRMRSRAEAVELLLRAEFSAQPNARAILFHESIAEVMALFERLRSAGFAVVAEHSELPDSYREQSLELFRKGTANVVVSAKSLIEGFNVPAADVGIIVASSTSVRQRIQSLGRVLRKHRGVGGEEKTSVIYVLYARETVDDAIYARTNWEEFTGAERNLYFIWEPGNDPVEQSGPPRSPLPTDVDVDVSQLAPGDPYEGQYEGDEYTTDTQGNIRDLEGRFVSNPGALPAAVKAVKGTAGRFRITPTRRYVLVRLPEGDEWTTRFVTQLREALILADPTTVGGSLDMSEHSSWIEKAAPGDEYPFPTGEPILKLHYRQRRGGVIAKKIRNGEAYARIGTDATDAARGEDARRLLDACRKLSAQELLGSKFEVNDQNDAICRTGGRTLFIAALKDGLEFPEYHP
jgi:superfamily II DNA or RNA helicase